MGRRRPLRRRHLEVFPRFPRGRPRRGAGGGGGAGGGAGRGERGGAGRRGAAGRGGARRRAPGARRRVAKRAAGRPRAAGSRWGAPGRAAARGRRGGRGTGRRKRGGTGRGERCGTGAPGARPRAAGSRRGARPPAPRPGARGAAARAAPGPGAGARRRARGAGGRAREPRGRREARGPAPPARGGARGPAPPARGGARGSAGARTRSTACTRSRRPGSMAMTRVLSTSNSSDASRARLRTSRVFSLLVTTGSARIGPSRCLSGRTFDLRNRRDAATPSVLTKKSKHRSRRPRLRNGASLKTDRQRASLALRRLYRLRSRTWNSFFRDSTPHSDAPKPSSKNVFASMRTWHMPIRAWGKRVKRRTRRRRAPARLRNSSDS